MQITMLLPALLFLLQQDHILSSDNVVFIRRKEGRKEDVPGYPILKQYGTYTCTWVPTI